ncbi:MAG: hypothetical protein UU88_C0004G0035 [Parcubacteria group bacterium GW2011_GWC1_42_11]|uniref:Uncharacterized protein n=1 Tax=Candidatus Nomurabacteria bacterium GW2011_GWC2_42_20 TaxID=1618756 RepID=A0A0G0ZFC4_9BACT|nr:MAG: hypothetical protein UU88_C0004G0035 [Parcubacteria group bacterium GW2011_GWC1_42_11]KKS47384.1 MAG: hypothetical protein UV12_C0008G0052 [Candidatus Nomurabacteria bacterium GW2011_GWC2_42_20]HBH71597.1 hypothetical protein [Candidatus Yonathbacteria bacterium]
MVYRTEVKKMGLTIKITTDRKHGNGAKGGGRKNTSGKKAVVSKEGIEDTTVRNSTTTGLLRDLRNQFKIPHSVQINREGETHI